MDIIFIFRTMANNFNLNTFQDFVAQQQLQLMHSFIEAISKTSGSPFRVTTQVT